MIEAGGEKVIAKVIVDVPLMQTDKPYSYQIPSEFEDMVEAGMRDRKSTRLNSSHSDRSRMPSSA